jgi:4-amino-4-deoxy-L-arabinose transferase-like glycosyltransferase
MRNFDVAHHQPHPPGYIGYIALGRLFQLVFGDANAALVALSIAGECVAVVIAFLFAKSLFGRTPALATALALISSPLYWYYGEAANTYALEPALVLLVVWSCWRVWNGSQALAPAGALALGLAGAVRPSTAVLLAPVYLVSLWRCGSLHDSVVSLALLLLATLAWLIPLIVLSAGIGPYLAATVQLGGAVTGGTAVWRAGPSALIGNSEAVLQGLVFELGFFGALAFFGLVVAPRFHARPRLPSGWGAFCLVWALPSLLTFLLVHIGQVAYVQSFAPALLLTLGPAVSATARSLGRARSAHAIAIAAAALNVVTFLFPSPHSLWWQEAAHDRWAAEMIAQVGVLNSNSTIIITDAVAVGSYRTLQAYLPQYHRLGVGVDRRGRLGEIYGDIYEPARFEHASGLRMPPGAGTFVFPDRGVVDAFVADPERMEVIMGPDHSRIYIWRGPAPRLEGGLIWLDRRYQDRRGMS